MRRLQLIVGLQIVLCLFATYTSAKTLSCTPISDGSYSGYLGKVIIVSKADGDVESVIFPSQIETKIYRDCSVAGGEYRCRLPGKYVDWASVVFEVSSVVAFVVDAESADLYSGHQGWHIVRRHVWIDTGSKARADGSFSLDASSLKERAFVNNVDVSTSNYECTVE